MKITKISTIGSQFDNNCVFMGGNTKLLNIYRMNADEFTKILEGVKFTEEKKRIHTYLSIVDESLAERFIRKYKNVLPKNVVKCVKGLIVAKKL